SMLWASSSSLTSATSSSGTWRNLNSSFDISGLPINRAEDPIMPVRSGIATFRAMAAATLLLHGVTVMADSAVWRVSDGSEHIYLGGTVHLLRPSDYPLPAAFDTAYSEADAVYFETDISALSDIGTQMRMMQQLTYSDERTLRSVLNDEAYAALSTYVAQFGLPMAALEKFRPGLLVSTLQVLEFQQMGFTP